jgi:aspartyl-tRNA synthetase
MKRTHNCGELRLTDDKSEISLAGWIDRRRDHGGLIFIDLRDKYGKTQVVFEPDQKDIFDTADSLRNEFVISIQGLVRPRLEGKINDKLPTGEIEIVASTLTILNKSEPLPIAINDHEQVSKEGEEVRARYRYLELRRPWVQKNISLKAEFLHHTRAFFYKYNFSDIETPVLCKSTPEGARDYLVPSRVNPGKFYALPQSPQTYKQLLMISGFDRYFQIAKCFRDEDLRADRQPEFTQIDVEMSFVDTEDVYEVFDTYINEVLPNVWKNFDAPGKIPRMTYADAMLKYGSDKPDIRFDMQIHDVTEIAKNVDFAVFKNVANGNGVVRGFAATGCVDFTRKQIDELTKFVGRYGAKGLVWMRQKEAGIESQVAKFFQPEQIDALGEAIHGQPGDMLFFIAADEKTTANALGHLRIEVAKMKGLTESSVKKFLWVVDFPMFEYSETENRYTSMHHPFTAPLDEHVEKFENGDFAGMTSKGYDLVLNGVEIGGGSIRIHQPDVQHKAFKALGLSDEEVRDKFGYFVDAFKYGAPPHGGLAFGVDRILATMENIESIRDFIPFPKTSTASAVMEESPSNVDAQQLLDVHITLNQAEEE